MFRVCVTIYENNTLWPSETEEPFKANMNRKGVGPLFNKYML